MKGNTLSTRLVGVLALSTILTCASFVSLSTAADSSTVLSAIVNGVASNENKMTLVQVSGTYATTMYDISKSVFKGERGGFIFYRNANVFQISMTREYWGVKNGATQQVISNWVSLGKTINFYDTVTNIVVDPDSDMASVGESSAPPVFPLSFGFWIRPMNNATEIRPFSKDISEGLSTHCLSLLPADPNYPSELVLQFTNSEVRVRWWIDPHRGFLITRAAEYVPIAASAGALGQSDALVFEEDSTLEKTGEVWYVKSGVRKTYAPNPSLAAKGQLSLYLQKEETLQVSDIGSLTALKPGEVAFSINRFPYVRYFYDFMNNRKIDLRAPHQDEKNGPSS